MLIVKKFGGSSVADRECLFRVAERCIEEYRKGILMSELSEKVKMDMLRQLSQIEGKNTTQKKVGRNDPCPCGSGKKYKKCCGK